MTKVKDRFELLHDKLYYGIISKSEEEELYENFRKDLGLIDRINIASLRALLIICHPEYIRLQK